MDETQDIVTRLRERYPKIQGPAAQDICYATENRQLAVKAVVPMCQLLLVVGSQNSWNSRRWSKVCVKEKGVASHLIDDLSEVRPEWLEGVDKVAVTAGASAPENLVQELIESLRGHGYGELEEVEIKEEDVRFNLPSELSRTVQLHTIARIMSPSLQLTDALVTSCAQTLRQGVKFLLGKQHRRWVLVG